MNNGNSNDEIIYCPRCGSEMKSSARYCMKCGNLNYNNEANESMKKIMGNQINEVSSYQIGAGGVISNVPVRGVKTALATNTGSDLACFLINYFLYIILLVIIIAPQISGGISIDILTSFSVAIPVTLISIYFLYCYSIELIFMKANKRWWSAFVPFYNFVVYADITFGKPIYAILFFIPVVGQVAFLVSLYVLGYRFKYNGFLTMFLPFFVIPHIALSSCIYNETMYVGGGEKSNEVFYGRRKVFSVTCLLCFLLSFTSFIYNNRDEINAYKRLIDNYYYVFAAKRITNKVRVKVDHNFYSCEDPENSKSSSTLGDYYFNYPDIGKKVFIPFYYSRDAISGYVRVNLNEDGYEYFVSISDGTYGFPEINIKDLTVKNVIKYKDVNTDFLDEDVRICAFGT
jgi:hypothetical protein